MAYLGWLFVGLLLGFGLAYFYRSKSFTVMNSFADDVQEGSPQLVAPLLKSHFKPTTTQFSVERDENSRLTHADLDLALDEMLFKGGSLNRKLLGAGQNSSDS